MDNIRDNSFDILLKNLGLQEINLLIAGHERCVSEHSFGPALRDFFLIHYIFSGEGHFRRDGQVYNLKKGDLFIIRPFESTFYQAAKVNPWHYCWIGFQTSISESEVFLSRDVIHAPECEHIFQAVRQQADLKEKSFNKVNMTEYFLTGKLFELFALLVENVFKSDSFSGVGSVETNAFSYIQKAIDYIHSNYAYSISVSTIAKNLGLDRSYFSKTFKEVTGKPPRQYIMDFRMNVAAELLSMQRCSVSEAALSSGFTDLPHFSRQFRVYFGTAPSQYRAVHNKK